MSDILEESSILAEAAESTGLSDFGDESFHEPFRRLLASISAEARLSTEGLLDGLAKEFICMNFARYRERLHRSEIAEQGRSA